MDPLAFLFNNPLIIAGVLGLISTLVYLSTENRYMKHKTRELRRSIMRGWGIFLLILAFLSLFTTSWHLILEASNVIPNMPTGYVTLEHANKLCIAGEFERCDIIDYGYWGSIIAIAIGIILIVVGSFKIRQRIQKAKRAEKRKKKGK